MEEFPLSRVPCAAPTDAFSKVGVQLICEEGFRQLPEVQFEGACNGINVHLTHHH